MTLKDCVFWIVMAIIALIVWPFFWLSDALKRGAARILPLAAMLCVVVSGQQICGTKTETYEVICGDKVVTPQGERYLAVTKVKVTSAVGGVAKVTLSKPAAPPEPPRIVVKIIELFPGKLAASATAIFNGDNWHQVEVKLFEQGKQ